MALKFFQKKGYAALAVVSLLAGCAASSSSHAPKLPISQPSARPATSDISNFVQRGEASQYARELHGKRTASGEVYRKDALTAAHRTLPFSSYVRVTNLANGKQVVVRINDRGPSQGKRIIDLSPAAAKVIGLKGVGRVEIRGLKKK